MGEASKGARPVTQLEVLAILIGLFAGMIGMSALYVGLRRSYYHEEG